MEIEQKISNQFTTSIGELQVVLEREKKEREQNEEKLVGYLKELAKRSQENLIRVKRDREINEEQLVVLIESVIEKLKREMAELEL